MDTSNLSISKEQLDGAFCLEFPEKFEIGGSFSDKFVSTIQLNISPCKPNPPELLCEAQLYNPDGTPNGLPVSTIDVSTSLARARTMALLSEFLQKLSIELGFPEDSPSLESFETPMARSFVFHNHLKINSHYANANKYYFSQTAVETESGSIKTEVTKKSGLKLESSNVSQISRKIEDTRATIYTENGITAFRTIPHFFFQVSIELTNKVYTLRKVYQTFSDYLGLLGGNFEIILFIFVLLATVHSTIQIKVNMLNYIVLKDQIELIEEPTKINQISDQNSMQKK